MREFFKNLFSESNKVEEVIVAGYLFLLLGVGYGIKAFFSPIDIEILKLEFYASIACFTGRVVKSVAFKINDTKNCINKEKE